MGKAMSMVTNGDSVDSDKGLWVSVGLSAPGFAAIALLAAVALHSAFTIPWRELCVAGIAVVVIQTAAWVSWFWARRRFRTRRDPRPSMVISGIYCVLIIWAGFYFAWRWQLVSSHQAFQDGLGIGVCVALATVVGLIVFSYW